MRMQARTTTLQAVPKPVRWVASSKDDLSAFPNDVKTRVGGALWDAQIGLKSPAAKPLKGFGDAGVLEVVVDFDGNTFRTVYTVRFAKAVYVLHAFQKKSRRAIARRRASWISSELVSLGPKRIMKHG
jgi:phage-related protein